MVNEARLTNLYHNAMDKKNVDICYQIFGNWYLIVNTFFSLKLFITHNILQTLQTANKKENNFLINFQKWHKFKNWDYLTFALMRCCCVFLSCSFMSIFFPIADIPISIWWAIGSFTRLFQFSSSRSRARPFIATYVIYKQQLLITKI